MKLVVLQIDVVNDFSQFAQTLDMAQAEAFHHGFESAVLTMMRKLSAEHVEGNSLLNLAAFVNEIKARMLIDELFDQPPGRKAVNVDVAPSHPTATLVFLHR